MFFSFYEDFAITWSVAILAYDIIVLQELKNVFGGK